MSNGNRRNLFFEGISEGFVMPLIEGLLALIIVKMDEAFKPIVNSTPATIGTIPFTFSDILLLFALMILFENVVLGYIADIRMAFGYCIGGFFSILCYASVMKNILPNLGVEVWGMIAIIGSGIVMRIIIAFYFENKRKEGEREQQW
jgi:hypothetical protein